MIQQAPVLYRRTSRDETSTTEAQAQQRSQEPRQTGLGEEGRLARGIEEYIYRRTRSELKEPVR
ncbi:hypothetical protein BJX96DRAFT_111171 [Aspergillus floccosus]